MLFAAIKRTDYLERETLGKFTLQGWDNKDILNLETLELPWKDNKNRVSCIPEGEYEVRIREPYESGSFNYTHFKIYDKGSEDETIKGNGYTREYILIHAANYYDSLLGCVALGKDRADIDSDGVIDITYSRDSLKKLVEEVESRGEKVFQLKVYSE